MTPDQILTLAPWGPPKAIVTARGPVELLKAPVTPEFRKAWQQDRAGLKADGVGWDRPDAAGQFTTVVWWRRAPGAAAAQEQAAVASRAPDSSFAVPVPDGLALLPFQRAGVAYVMDSWARGTGALLADEMGLGKTVQAIGAMNVLGASSAREDDCGPVLIVCPNTLKENWRFELQRWLCPRRSVGVQYAGKPWCDAQVIVINYDIISRYAEQIAATPWGMLVCDEAHYLCNPKAARTKAVNAIQARRLLYMTGTPMSNRPLELLSLISRLAPGQWKDWPYKMRYCGAKQIQVVLPPRTKRHQNGRIERLPGGPALVWDFSGSSHEQELQARLRGTILVRRLKADVMQELPPKIRRIVLLPSDEVEGLLWEERNLAGQVADRIEQAETLDFEAASSALREAETVGFRVMSAVRARLGLAKVPHAVEFIREALAEGPVVLFLHHVEAVAAVAAEFPGAAIVTGATPAQDRMAEVGRFQSGATDLFIGNLAAAEGITLTRSAHVVIAEPQWNPAKTLQQEDRCHRKGQERGVLVSYLVFDRSLDAAIVRVQIAKMEVADRVLDREAAPQGPVPQRNGAEKPPGAPVGAPTRARSSHSSQSSEPAAEPEPVSVETVLAVHAALKQLAAQDGDHARDRNGVGFARLDVAFGHSLAAAPFLTARQAAAGLRLCRKYRGQLGPGPWEATGKQPGSTGENGKQEVDK